MNKNRPQPGDLVVLKCDYHLNSAISGCSRDYKIGDLGINIRTWSDEVISVLFEDGGSYASLYNGDYEVIDTSLRGVIDGWLELNPQKVVPPQEKPVESNVITVMGRKIRVTFSGNVLKLFCAECDKVLGMHYLGNLIHSNSSDKFYEDLWSMYGQTYKV